VMTVPRACVAPRRDNVGKGSKRKIKMIFHFRETLPKSSICLLTDLIKSLQEFCLIKMEFPL